MLFHKYYISYQLHGNLFQNLVAKAHKCSLVHRFYSLGTKEQISRVVFH